MPQARLTYINLCGWVKRIILDNSVAGGIFFAEYGFQLIGRIRPMSPEGDKDGNIFSPHKVELFQDRLKDNLIGSRPGDIIDNDPDFVLWLYQFDQGSAADRVLQSFTQGK